VQVRDKIWRRLLCFGLCLETAVAVLALISWLEARRNANEEYAVYSAYLSDGLLSDVHDWSMGGPVQVVVEDRTQVGGHIRFWPLYVLDSNLRFNQLHSITGINFVIRNLLHNTILNRFSLPERATVVLASHSGIQDSGFQKRFPASLGFVTLSGVGFNPSHTQALFYIDHFCGLCGGGRYVLMEKTNGLWHVSAEHYTWIS
jgi:hypothetical protein